MSRIFRKMVCRLWHERSQPAMEASSRAASRCFMFMYFLLPHWVPATWRSRAQTSMRAELPSGKLPTTRVRRRISRFSRSMTLGEGLQKRHPKTETTPPRRSLRPVAGHPTGASGGAERCRAGGRLQHTAEDLERADAILRGTRLNEKGLCK